MNSNIDVVRLSAKDSAMIDKFVRAGEFQNKSEFVTYAIEKDKCNPSFELAFRLADFFGITIEELFVCEHHYHSNETETKQ